METDHKKAIPLEEECRWYVDFICFMGLYKEFQEFKKNAHEKRDIFGLPYYTWDGSPHKK